MLKRLNSRVIESMAVTQEPDTPDLERADYLRNMGGMAMFTRHARTWKDLPSTARSFLHRIGAERRTHSLCLGRT